MLLVQSMVSICVAYDLAKITTDVLVGHIVEKGQTPPPPSKNRTKKFYSYSVLKFTAKLLLGIKVEI